MKKTIVVCIAAAFVAACGSSGDVSFGSGGSGGETSGSANGGGGAGGGGGGGSAVVCTSNMYWLLGDLGNQNMHPGVPCIDCHVAGGKAQMRTFDIAGTVYPTAHEPDDCMGVNVTGATVVITDANGADHALPVNAAGNFDHKDFFGTTKFATPYKAKVVYQGKERAMQMEQTDGNCNACHTADAGLGPPTPGVSAPGRIMLP